ncbi:MAG: hypothetical protein Kow00108_14350 [Calditrichia bacterium]
MVPVFVVLTILIFIVFDYFFRWKPAQQAAKLSTAPVNRLLDYVPKGVFFQNNFTWAMMNPEGSVSLGLNPLLLGLTEKPDKIQLLVSPGQQVQKGDPLAKLKKQGKELTVYSTMNGTVRSLNPDIIEEPVFRNWVHNWFIKVDPENVEEVVSRSAYGEKAKEWMQNNYNKIKEFISSSIGESEPAYSMADGGELPIGVLSKLDNEAWQKFEQDFLKIT